MLILIVPWPTATLNLKRILIWKHSFRLAIQLISRESETDVMMQVSMKQPRFSLSPSRITQKLHRASSDSSNSPKPSNQHKKRIHPRHGKSSALRVLRLQNSNTLPLLLKISSLSLISWKLWSNSTRSIMLRRKWSCYWRMPWECLVLMSEYSPSWLCCMLTTSQRKWWNTADSISPRWMSWKYWEHASVCAYGGRLYFCINTMTKQIVRLTSLSNILQLLSVTMFWWCSFRR